MLSSICFREKHYKQHQQHQQQQQSFNNPEQLFFGCVFFLLFLAGKMCWISACWQIVFIIVKIFVIWWKTFILIMIEYFSLIFIIIWFTAASNFRIILETYKELKRIVGKFTINFSPHKGSCTKIFDTCKIFTLYYSLYYRLGFHLYISNCTICKCNERMQ